MKIPLIIFFVELVKCLAYGRSVRARPPGPLTRIQEEFLPRNAQSLPETHSSISLFRVWELASL